MRNPYDGATIATVAVGGDGGRRGGRRRGARAPGPPPPPPRRRCWSAPPSLVGAPGRGLRPHDLPGGRQADQAGPRARRRGASTPSSSRPSRRARWPARWSRWRPARPGAGKVGHHPARAHRRGRRDLPVQLPAEPGGPQAGAGDRRRLPGRAQARLRHAAVGAAAGPRPRRRRACPRATCRSSPAAAAPSATRWSTTRTSPMISFTGSPPVGLGHPRAPAAQGGRPGARQLHPGDRGAPTPTWSSPPRKLGRLGLHPRRASRASRCSASTCRRPRSTRFRDLFVERVEALVVGDPMDDATDVGPLIDRGNRDRVAEWIDEASARPAPRILTGGTVQRRPAAADGARRHLPRHEGVVRGGVRPGRRPRPLRHARRGHRARQRLALRPAGGHLHRARRRRAGVGPAPALRRRD